MLECSGFIKLLKRQFSENRNARKWCQVFRKQKRRENIFEKVTSTVPRSKNKQK